MDAKISIIIPVYNVELYLSRCIESVLCQTYKNFELILINDGSTDNSLKICKLYQERDNRIKLIDKCNEGVSSARNEGLNIAQGEYITFVDSDDYIHEKYLEKLLFVMNEKNCDMVYCSYKNVWDNDFAIVSGTQSIKTFKGIECFQGLYSSNPENLIVPWGKLYKSTLFHNLRYEVGKIHEDEFMVHRILSKCNVVCYFDYTLYFYYQRKGSIMNSNFNPNRLVRLEALIERYNILKDTCYESNAIDSILKDCIYFYLLIPNSDYENLSYVKNIFTKYIHLGKIKFNKQYLKYTLFKLNSNLYKKIAKRR